MNVNQVNTNSPVSKVTAQPIQKSIDTDAAAPSRSSDRVELSGMSHLLQSLKANDVRADKVESVRAQIEAGTYEDDSKLDIAADRLLDDLNR